MSILVNLCYKTMLFLDGMQLDLQNAGLKIIFLFDYVFYAGHRD